MKPFKKIYPSSNYPYYFLNKIIIPNEPIKKEVIIEDDITAKLKEDFMIDLLLFSVSPSKEIKYK